MINSLRKTNFELSKKTLLYFIHLILVFFFSKVHIFSAFNIFSITLNIIIYLGQLNLVDS